MTPDDMARELRAAGWFEDWNGTWAFEAKFEGLLTFDAWEELAQQRERGTVTTPVVGAEEKR